MSWTDSDSAFEPLARMDLTVSRTIVTWGFTRLLALHRRRVAEVRDSIAISKDKSRGAGKRLNDARQRLLTDAGDARQTAVQAKRWTGNESAFKYDLPELRPVRPELWRDPTTTYPELLRVVVAERSDLLQEEEARSGIFSSHPARSSLLQQASGCRERCFGYPSSLSF
jgi:hypothetical protein